ncbi:MAG: CocE/NonD family hydrolase, partial [Bulleidia sp.]
MKLRTCLKKIIAFCMLAGSLCACRESDLTELGTGERLTVGAAAEILLNRTGLSEEVLGTSEEDQLALARSLGMLGNEDPEQICSRERLCEMKETAEQVKKAVSSESLQPLFLNGMAQPIFPYSAGTAGNQDHAIIRFGVYVETDYDTDGDGKRDLIKAVVQVPEAAARGDYQAAVIYEARPYSSGCTPFYEIDEIAGDSYDLRKLYAQPDPRVPAGEISTPEAARRADVSDWYYYNPYEDRFMYENLDWYDYYLIRGYAVVLCAGPGTYQSEGFQTCGSELEIAAFRSVIEWLTGDRKAYADLDSDLEIRADWCNGAVGMTGMSYGGATQFGVAGTGVRGLKTIVPVSGIASWYEYVNSQGAPIIRDPDNQLSSLALYCAGRYLDPEDWKTIEKNYGDYLHQLQRDQMVHGSDYSEFWKERDYTLQAENLNCSALIVQGLNDGNVKTKQADLMAGAFQKAGMPVKLLLHQDAHVTPVSHAGRWAMLVNGEPYEDLLNRWFSHYLYGIENGIEKIPAMLVQNSHDPERWDVYDNLQAAHSLSMHADQSEDRIISSARKPMENSVSWRAKTEQEIT